MVEVLIYISTSASPTTSIYEICTQKPQIYERVENEMIKPE
jgi:hypothetical protein